MAQLQAGDDAALAVLMQRWEAPVKSFIFRLIGNAAEAEDLAQEVFVRIYTKRQSYRPGAKFSTWLFAISANQAKNRLRWWKRRPTLSINVWLDEGGDLEDESKSPDLRVSMEEQAQRTAALQQAIAELPLEQRTTLVLFEYEEKSMTEVAEIMGCSPKTVENRLYRSRQSLRRKLGVV
jgi:RNA polymerase sigma-70 factor (ECF subfamily)